MAASGEDKQDLTEATHEPRECMACRGTGRVISNLGGNASTVSCPWCEGSGLRPAEIDAQAHWAAALEAGEGAAEGAGGKAGEGAAEGAGGEGATSAAALARDAPETDAE